MTPFFKTLSCLTLCLFLQVGHSFAQSQNQTAQLSPVLPGNALPFQVTIEQASFQLPGGWHSGLIGQYNGLWVFIGGTNMGLHGFFANAFPRSNWSRKI